MVADSQESDSVAAVMESDRQSPTRKRLIAATMRNATPRTSDAVSRQFSISLW
jgi:hypothetical protein